MIGPAIRTTIDGPVAEITLDRPALLNRFDGEMHDALIETLRELRARSDLRVAVLRAEGKAFSAGGDFEFMRIVNKDTALRLHFLDQARLLLSSLLDLPIPVVAAVHGDAIGLGATVALACDIVVGSANARIYDPHVAVGLVAGDGGCLVWPQSIGMARAKRYLLTGDPLTAADAHALGLISDLVGTPEEAGPYARALAERIAALPPLAVQGTKRVLNSAVAARAGEVIDLGVAQEAGTLASEDLIEAIEAFTARRPPVYRGC
jgi:enoyl-CoA hydratase